MKRGVLGIMRKDQQKYVNGVSGSGKGGGAER